MVRLKNPSNSKKTPWYEVYHELSRLLSNLIEVHDDPGEELYTILTADNGFKHENTWIEKFEKEFGIKSVDPLHIFASINANRQAQENRLERINILFRCLDYSEPFEAINFAGCPTPATMKLLGVRKKENQEKVWDVFRRAHRYGRKGVTSADFKGYRNWYGLEFSSFTTLLFWISSDNFLPMERNVRTFLVSSRISGYAPKNFNSYMTLLKKIDKFNYLSNDRYGEKGLFREIAHIAYEVITEGKEDLNYSLNFEQLLSESTRNIETASTEKGRKYDRAVEEEELKSRVVHDGGLGRETVSKLPDTDWREIAKLGFKLIAIRTTGDCDLKYRRNLDHNKLYYFEKTVDISEDKIEYHADRNMDIYSTREGGSNDLYVNVSAVVGKNGSGKSSLIELLFAIINNVSFKRRSSLKTKGLSCLRGLSAELYYIHSGFLYNIAVKGDDIKIREFELVGSEFKMTFDWRAMLKADFPCFFYTLAVNYSHYALNSNHLGLWIQGLFHKNDRYQTPIVINPMRTKGNIDINKENKLVKSRLLANLLAPVESENNTGFRQMTEKQKATSIDFKLIPNKNDILYEVEVKNDFNKNIPFSAFKGKEKEVYDLVKDVFEFGEDFKDSRKTVIRETKRYILRKLVRISLTYTAYKGCFKPETKNFKSKKVLRKFLEDLKGDESHISFKLKQAINYWKYPQLWSREPKFTLVLSHEGERLENFLSTEAKGKTIEFVPPSIFSSTIHIEDSEKEVGGKKEKVSFEDLSSGEKQIIHSVSSIIYHLTNLDSVPQEGKDIHYSAINLVLDEIELYYHPETQRAFIAYLLESINRIELPTIDALNICMITHSPYILSDILENNILKLEDGSSKPEAFKTFGANIHDLLANEFFMYNGFMGDWAKRTIDEIIEFLNYTKLKRDYEELTKKDREERGEQFEIVKKKLEDELNYLLKKVLKREIGKSETLPSLLESTNFKSEQEYSRLINAIGEPVLRDKLRAMHNELFALDDKLSQLRDLADRWGLNVNIESKE